MAKVPGFAEARSDREAQARPASEKGNGCRNSALIRAALPDGVHRVFHASGANHEQ